MRAETLLQRNIRKHIALRGFRSVHVPNGMVLAGDPKARAIQMNSMKSQGLCVGFPDLIVFADNARTGFIEVKIEGEQLGPKQIEVKGWLSELGHAYSVCRSLEDVDDTLTQWGWL